MATAIMLWLKYQLHPEVCIKMITQHYIESIRQRLEDAILVLRHITKLFNDGGFIDCNIRNDFTQSIHAIYNISLFMRWQTMEQIALKLLELSDGLKIKSHDDIVANIEKSFELLRQMKLLIEHVEMDTISKKEGERAAL